MKNILLLCGILFCTSIFAQRDFDKVEIEALQVSDNIYMLKGSGGNIGVLTGEEGTLIIDTQFAPLSEKIKSAISDITDHDVNYVVNTHWHGDHTGGNKNFSNDGAVIIAHDNVRKRLSTNNVRPFGRTTEAAPEEAWPHLTFNDKLNFYFNGHSLHLTHVHNAHTDGDVFIYFADANVLHMGDCFFKDRFPFIDTALGGSPDGALKAISVALMICDDDTKIIPGHGSLAKKEDLIKYNKMLMTLVDRVKASIEDDKSLEEALNSNLTEGYEGWGSGFINDEKIIKTLYAAYQQ